MADFNVVSLIFLLVIIPEILCFIEMIFGLYTVTEGICTGVVRKENSKSRRIYYEVYVSDFEKKRELVIKQYDYCYIRDLDRVIVTHGCFSKRVMDIKTSNHKIYY